MSVCGRAAPAPDPLPPGHWVRSPRPSDAHALVSAHRPLASTEKEALRSRPGRLGQGHSLPPRSGQLPQEARVRVAPGQAPPDPPLS